MPETLEDVLPPPPHKLVKEAAVDIKSGMKDIMDDVKSLATEMAPHNLVKNVNPKDILPPLEKPPKPPKLPRMGD